MRLVLVSRWLWRWLTRPCWSADGTPGRPMGLMQESWSVHLFSRLLRGQGGALDGAAGSVTNSALSLSGAASCCAALRDAALRCELRAAPRCCDALLGVGGPEWHARVG